MSIYELPEFKFPQLKKNKKMISLPKLPKKRIPSWAYIVLFALLFSLLGGIGGSAIFYSQIRKEISDMGLSTPTSFQIIKKELTLKKPEKSEGEVSKKPEGSQPQYIPQSSQEAKVIHVVRDVSPSVVSIIISKDMPVLEKYYTNPFGSNPFNLQIPQYRQKGTKEQQIGGGTGFVISKDGMILTNKHVASIKGADYTVLMNNGKKYPAKVLALDPYQDLAVLKIKPDKPLKPLNFGDSSHLEIGQTVIAIGNALGEFQNTVSVGVISGLKRSITASGEGASEKLENIIQTDAAINRGNSGGPLLNLSGKVIGINTAMSVQGENIGFAIPINTAKKDIQQVKTIGKIVYAFLGVRYVLVTPDMAKQNNLTVDYGALIVEGDKPEQVAVTPGSAADKAGLKKDDIILEFNGERVTAKNSLAKIIRKYNPGDKVSLKILHQGKEKTVQVTLGERE